MRTQKFALISLSILLMLQTIFFSTITVAEEHDDTSPPELSAEAAALIDVKSGRILYEKEGDKRLPIASITKIMTAIIALENHALDDIVTVSDRAEGVEGSSIYLRRGEKVKLINLLYGLMLRSGNDAAVAIAEHVGGSVEGFVFLMNQKAEELGMNNTHFANPHGLDDEKHYSTARDMAILTAYAMGNPVFQEIVSTRVKSVDWPGEQWNRLFINKNKMLRYYKGADGVKTGYTRKANRTLVSSATRDGMQLAAVTLNDPDDWMDHTNLLDWGFEHFVTHPIVSATTPVKEWDEKKGRVTALYPVRDFSYPLRDGEKERIRKKLNLFDENMSRKKLIDGSIAGHLLIYLDEQQIASIGLQVQTEQTTVTSVHHWFSYWVDFWKTWFGGM